MWSHHDRFKSAKCGGHKSCESGDMIYFNLKFKNKDISDYLITKCDNSSSLAVLTYIVLQGAAK